ncbi:hypothetical protein IH981_01980 [Patescibacteria group bacterium]|nr:hypothetical protein [Patescibacteria group bacterium]
MICPVNQRVERNKNLILDRLYPGKCKPAVRVGANVAETDIIAHCEISAGRRLVKIAHNLGVSGKDVGKYLTRKIGDSIYEGEIIARRKGFVGIGKKEIKSPVDGLISEIDVRGDLILKFLPKPIRLIAGAGGQIKEISDNKISIDTIATKIHGFVSSGKLREGIISVIGSPKEFIIPSSLKPDVNEKILVGGALLEKSALEKAVTLGVAGIIVGGMNYRDFENLTSGGDVGTSVMVTEGFGTAPLGDDIWQLLKKKEGRLGFISGEENALLIPEVGEDQKQTVSTSTWRELRVGDRVLVLRKGTSNLLGEVKELPGEQIINSGILTEVALVSFSPKEQILFPVANLEIIE